MLNLLKLNSETEQLSSGSPAACLVLKAAQLLATGIVVLYKGVCINVYLCAHVAHVPKIKASIALRVSMIMAHFVIYIIEKLCDFLKLPFSAIVSNK